MRKSGFQSQPRPDTNGTPFKIEGVYCKLIPLTQGQFAIVDTEDYEFLSQWKWSVTKAKRIKCVRFYAVRRLEDSPGAPHLRMHRVILARMSSERAPDSDHRNTVTLDNRRKNLRWATRAQNLSNVPLSSNNTTGFKGVCQRSPHSFSVNIRHEGRRFYIGSFSEAHLAGAAYAEAALRLKGEFARIS